MTNLRSTCLLAALAFPAPPGAAGRKNESEWKFEYVGFVGADYRRALAAFEERGGTAAFEGGALVAGAIREAKRWERLWAWHHPAGDVPVPPVEFASDLLVYVRSAAGGDCTTVAIGKVARTGDTLEARVVARRCPERTVHKACHSGFAVRAIPVGDAKSIAFVFGERRVELPLRDRATPR